MHSDLREAIVIALRYNQHIGMNCDLACYVTHDSYYFVDYLYSKGTINLLDLTPAQQRTIIDEEELIEMFDTPEDAADFYIKLSGGNLNICSDLYGHENGHTEKRRTLKEKVLANKSDRYF